VKNKGVWFVLRVSLLIMKKSVQVINQTGTIPL